MGTRADQLATQLEQVTDTLAAAIEQMPPGRWRAACAAEGRPVGVVAHHAAGGHLSSGTVDFIRAVATGQPFPPLTLEMVDQMNAEHARRHADCAKEETLELLRRNGPAAVAAIRALSDEQLDAAAPMAFAGGAPVSAQHIIETVLIGNVRNHLASIRATS